MTTPTADLIRRVRERHYACDCEVGDKHCRGCPGEWEPFPCEVTQLADTLEQSEREIHRLHDGLKYQIAATYSEKQSGEDLLAQRDKEAEQVRMRLGLVSRVTKNHENHLCPADDCFECWPGDLVDELEAFAANPPAATRDDGADNG